MARRRKTSPAEDLMDLVALLPWWVGVALGAVSYLILHSIATQPITVTSPPGQIGAMVGQSIWKGLATAGQYAMPIICLAGAAISAWRRGELIEGPKLHQMIRIARGGVGHSPAGSAPSPLASATPTTTGTPSCPQCAKPMVRRSAKRGANAGSEFWGCTSYPTCRGARPIA